MGRQVVPSVICYPSNWGAVAAKDAITFDVLVAHVRAINSWDRRISCVVHPEAVGVVESEKFGNIRTEVGPAGYVLSTGERVSLVRELLDPESGADTFDRPPFVS